MNKKLRKAIRKVRRKQQDTEEGVRTSVPRITNETVAAHREEVLSGARKYIYPLQHSKHRVVLISTGLFIAAVIAFVSYTVISLYRLQKSSTFLYRVTQVLPLPIARTGKYFVAYENYLFELRHYVHFYETQQKLDFESEEGKAQLALFRQRALDKVVDTAYLKQLAKERGITVSEKEIDEEIEVAKSQNRLGGDSKIFEDVLKDYYGWSVADFRRTLKDKILQQKVTAAIDPAAKQRADDAYTRLAGGQDFATVAREVSEDEFTKANGGELGFLVDQTSRDLPPEVADELFKLQPGQVTKPIETSTGYTIAKLIEVQGNKAKVAQMVFKYKDISEALNDLKDKQKARIYLNLPATPAQDTAQPQIEG